MLKRLQPGTRPPQARPAQTPSTVRPSAGAEGAAAAAGGDRLHLESGAALERTVARTRPTPIAPEGHLDYYRKRHADFLARYPEAPPSPPTYYLGYGDLYVRRFTERLMPELSREGQEWMVRARRNLQMAIEAELARNPGLELDDAAFTRFAYETHSRAYLDAGLTKLPIDDLIRVAVTPNLSDTLNLQGMQVVFETAEQVARDKLAAAMEAPADTTQEVLNAVRTSPDLLDDVCTLLATTDNARTLKEGLVRIGTWPARVAVSLMDQLWESTSRGLKRSADALRGLTANLFGD